MFEDFIRKFKDSTAGIPDKTKYLIAGLGVVVITILILVLVALNKPNYKILFTGLSQNDAGKIVAYLQENNVEYKYDNGGTTILVQDENVYDVRMELANEGIPSDGVVGYEIFDGNNFGMTEYVQQVNYKRALEGELQRTISQLEEVDAARVHLVIPEEALFEEDQSDPSAAITLKLRPSARLNNQQVEAIRQLVSSSVDKLDPMSVTIVDNAGNMLTENTGKEASETSTQHKYQQKMEEYLETKAQSMLDGVLGYGKAIVRVTADLSFEQVEETREMYDPENQIIRSEERIENSSMAPDTSSSAQEHIITNYEMNRTIQSIIKDVGVIDRLNVAVLVDGTYETNAEGTNEYQPRTVEEMQRLENIVKAAVGYATERGDQFEISNIQFDMSQFEEQERQMAELERRQFWQDIINKGLSVGLILFFLLLLRRVVKRSKVIIGDMPFAGNGEISDEDLIGQKREDLEIEMSEEVTEQAQIQDAIKKFTDKNPVQVTNLLRTWLVEK